MAKHRKSRWLSFFAVLVALAGVTAYLWSLSGDGPSASSSAGSAQPPFQLSSTASSVEGYTVLSKKQEEIHRGDLILVNNDHAYVFPSEGNLLSVYENKNQYYQVSTTEILLDAPFLTQFNAMMEEFSKAQDVRDIIVVSGYRSKADQEEILDQKIQQLGQEEAMRWAAVPGYSEHHTGLAADIGIYTSDGKSPSYQGQGKYAWINQHCAQYGFVLRYQEDKQDITQIAHEPWHYRYVGVPHASIMEQENLCLEEYIDFLKRYPYDGPHLTAQDSSGKGYEIYYVPAQGETVEVPVPVDRSYQVSGNNVDGFIVTVEL